MADSELRVQTGIRAGIQYPWCKCDDPTPSTYNGVVPAHVLGLPAAAHLPWIVGFDSVGTFHK